MDKRDYTVAEGVAWVNGRRVPESRMVSLTLAEASFDLALGRIAPVADKPAKKGRAVKAAADGDEPAGLTEPATD
jgi:hypothetical protein